MNTLSEKQIGSICLMSFLVGMLFFAWYYEMIIFRFPTKHFQLTDQNQACKKAISLIYFKDGIWQSSVKDMILTHDMNSNCKLIIQQLSNVLVEEKIIIKPLLLQDCMYSNTQELYISFAKSPLPKQTSIYEKSLIIESILATLQVSEIPIKHVIFCLAHQPLQDNHLDFSKPWPIEGFMQKGAGI